MAEERYETREINWRQFMPWTELFRGFRVAIGFSKLLLAAAGIVVMALGWYALAAVFNYSAPDLEKDARYQSTYFSNLPEGPEREAAKWKQFRQDWEAWNLIQRAAGYERKLVEPADLAESKEEYDAIKAEIERVTKEKEQGQTEAQVIEARRRKFIGLGPEKKIPSAAELDKLMAPTVKAARLVYHEEPKPMGSLRTLPWFEDRGPNPYLMVTGQAGTTLADGTVRRFPWEEGHFWEFLVTKQLPVLVEPLYKFLLPVIYFFNPKADFYDRFYFLLVTVWTLATWALFGGAITRIAAVEVARNEKISIQEALRFTIKRYLHFFGAPLLPLALVGGVLVVMGIFGIVHMIPFVGDILVDGLLWWVALGLGLIMAGVLVGLVCWPLMSATISADDEEAINAVSRSYSYVIQAPWHYLWYSAVALAYGAVVVFFVGFMGSMTVYLAKWGVGLPASLLAPGRDPSFLFIYAPTSFGWHDLLMQGASVDPASLYFYNRVGAGLVGFWLGVFFLLILGFSYSYFWSASTIIYLLMRKKVDDADLDEVYLEEEDQEEGFAPTPARATAPPPAPTPAYTTAGASQMVDAPTLRTPSAPPPPPSPPPPTPPPPKQEETGSAATNNPPATRSEPPRPDEEKADKKSDEAK